MNSKFIIYIAINFVIYDTYYHSVINKNILEYYFIIIFSACAKYCTLCRSSSSGLSAPGKTRLDRERAKMCQGEMASI